MATLKDEIIKCLEELPTDKQKETLDFALFLRKKSRSKTPRKSLLGLWQPLNVDVSDSDIKEMRRETLKSFPRKIDL